MTKSTKGEPWKSRLLWLFLGALIPALVAGFVAYFFGWLDQWLTPNAPKISIECGTTHEFEHKGQEYYLSVVVINSEGGRLEDPRVDIDVANPLLDVSWGADPSKYCEAPRVVYGQGPGSSLVGVKCAGFESNQRLEIALIAKELNASPRPMTVTVSGAYYKSREERVPLSFGRECNF